MEQKAKVHSYFIHSGVRDGLPGTAGGQIVGNPIIRNSNKLLHNSIGLIRFTCDIVSVIRSVAVLNPKEFDKISYFLVNSCDFICQRNKRHILSYFFYR